MPRLRPRRPARLLAAAALALSLAACGSDAPAAGTSSAGTATGSAAAPGAGELVVYSGRNKNLVGPLLERFSAETGTTVTPRYGDSAGLAAQLIEEGERTDADVFFSQDAGALGAVGGGGRLDALPAATLGKVERRFRAEDGTWVGTSGRARVLAYDPRQVPKTQLPKSVFELTGPQWKDKVAWAPTNASFQAFVTAMRTLAGDARTEEWLTAMKANGAKAYDNNNLVLDAVDGGQAAAGLLNHYYWFEKAAEVGQDKVQARLHFFGNADPGALVNVAGAAVVKGSDQPKAARAFVDWLLSRGSQSYFATETFEYPLAAGVSSAPGLPALTKLGAPTIDLADLEDLQGTLEMLEKVGLT